MESRPFAPFIFYSVFIVEYGLQPWYEKGMYAFTYFGRGNKRLLLKLHTAAAYIIPSDISVSRTIFSLIYTFIYFSKTSLTGFVLFTVLTSVPIIK